MSDDAMQRAVEAVVESHLAAMHAAGVCVEPSQISERTRRLIAKQVRQPVEVAEPILRADERERVLAPIRALHAGVHQCTTGSWYTDDPNYRGRVAHFGPCPTLAAIEDKP